MSVIARLIAYGWGLAISILFVLGIISGVNEPSKMYITLAFVILLLGIGWLCLIAFVEDVLHKPELGNE